MNKSIAESTLKIFLLGTLISLMLSIILLGSVPPVSRDALTHHLAIPAIYLDNGGIVELPDIIPSYYPQLLDIIYCIPLVYNNDIIPKYIHFLFALLTAGLIFIYIKKQLNTAFALVGTVFFLSIPVIVKLSTTVYVDLGFIFFSFASLLFILKWKNTNFNFSYILISAVFCGLALSTKYNGLITLFILTPTIVLIYLKKNRSFENQIKSLFLGCIFFMVAGVIFSPWMIKNYIWTNNPVYPLYDNYFNESNEDNRSSWNHMLTRKYVYNEGLLETALIPVRIFFQGQDDNPKFFDGKLNPLLFLLPFFVFLKIKPSRLKPFSSDRRILLWFSIIYILAVFFQRDMRIRYVGPAIPPLVILSTLGLYNLTHIFQNKKYSILISIIIVFFFGFNLNYIYKEFKDIQPLSYLEGKISRDEYIQTRRPEYASLQFANKHLGAGTRLLAFFLGNRMYYSDHSINFDKDLFLKLVKNSRTAPDILHGLQDNNFTHLIINYPEFNKWVKEVFSNSEKIVLKDFFKQSTRYLFSKDNHGVYQLGM